MSSERSTTEVKWKKRTARQRLSHRSILRFVELADQFARDLRTILLPKKERENGNALDVYFVSANRHPEFGPRRYEGKPVRFYSLRLLKTFRLIDETEPDGEKRIAPVFEWIKERCEAFKPLFDVADHLEDHPRDHYALFVEGINEAKTHGKPITGAALANHEIMEISERVHGLLVEAIAAMPYTELLPSALDRYFCRENWECNDCQPAEFHLRYDDKRVLINDEHVQFVKESDKLIPHDAFPGSRTKTEREEQAKNLGELYIERFINWFVLGYPPRANDGSQEWKWSPYSKKSPDLDGFAMPIYHAFDSSGVRVGGFEGWAIVYGKKYKSAFKKLTANADALTLALRSFSRRIREERMRELLEKEWLATSDRRTFTLQHFREFDGWIRETRRHSPVSFAKQHWKFGFLAETRNFSLEVYDPDQPDSFGIEKISHIAVLPPVDLNSVSPRDSNPLIFRKRDDTVLPSDHHALVDYGFHITQSVGQIYNAARLKEHAAQAGRASAADEAHAKTAHQMRKLTRHIHSKTRPSDLDALRSYYSLTFLHPKTFLGTETVRMACDINNSYEFGREFLKGATLEALVRSTYRYAANLYPILLKLHNSADFSGTRPRLTVTFSRNKAWRSPVWSHQSAISTSARTFSPLDPEDAVYLQCKSFFYVALVALWLNIMEHAPRSSRVSITVDQTKRQMIVKNKAAGAVRQKGSNERSLGTSHTLHYYFRSCFPEGYIKGEVSFPDKPVNGTFTTIIPIPLEHLCQHS